ncbi:GTPase IMAP family member 7-like [Megalobrama amblycephala]|uniref:GTPase IMAP family member 7-like n=1 Tax=Megalobrama amblycephala TaxID=75352 RepID=UPI0020141A6B|nr:GTPase IMAP family member 7-like [Megalobrama amblycephala]
MGCISSVSESTSERKIVLLGKSGDGKSSAGNTILGEKVFNTKASASTARDKCLKAERKVHGRNITVIDTPGDFDTDCDDEALKSEAIRSLVECAPGVDAFIIVLKVGRYAAHENTFKEEHVLKHTVILFTHGEQLEGKTIEAFMEDCPQLQELVDKCGGRCHVIDSKYWDKRKRGNKSNRVQVKNLLKTIDKMVNENGCYTNELLQKVEEDIQEEMKNITEDNLHPEEQREEAKGNVHASYQEKSAGMGIGAVFGALVGMRAATDLALCILQPYVALQTALTAAGAGAIVAGVLGVGSFAGAAVGAVIGWKAVGEAESVCDTIAKAAVDTWDNGLYVFKKAEEMCGLNSKMAKKDI